MSFDEHVDDQQLIDPETEQTYEGIGWSTAQEISHKDEVDSEAVFIKERGHQHQGKLGDCWVVAAIACITQDDTVFKRVVPDGQCFESEDHSGCFCFNFWRNGSWKKVHVDDRLPTVAGELVFTHSRHCCEFWGALLEKAYAKEYGSYHALEGGQVGEALTDFTGGIVEFYDISNKNDNSECLENLLSDSAGRNLLAAGCVYKECPAKELPNGLINQHAYPVLRAEKVTSDDNNVLLLCLLHTLDCELNWSGKWSSRSEKWIEIPEEVKQNLHYNKETEGYFCMEFQEFWDNFQTFEMCHLITENAENQETSSEENPTFSSGSSNKENIGEMIEVLVEIMQMPADASRKMVPIAFDLCKLPEEQRIRDTHGQMGRPVQRRSSCRRFLVEENTSYEIKVRTLSETDINVLVRVLKNNSLLLKQQWTVQADQ